LSESLTENTTYQLRDIQTVVENQYLPMQINHIESMISIYITEEEVVDFKTACSADESRFNHFFHAMLDQGIYLPPSPSETWFLADSLTKDLLDQTIEAADKSLHIVKEAL